ncbi:kinase-like protein [Massarina eburnea CBS 473.64]|uniref:Kinase-like protein n=1 Tax=Massarina eburnea CBS 473.64 TaxID=1395130 RepID=A0A6A6SB40_9PLEO|nr:kinase-like protein [Massarina eburnea CBS 473.64]
MAADVKARVEFEAYIKANHFLGTNGASADDEQPFITLRQLAEYWTTSRIKEALCSTYDNSEHIPFIQGHLIRIFSIFVLLKSPAFIFQHVHRLKDQNLPYYSQPEPWLFPIDFQEFYRAQWQFCPQEFNRQYLMLGGHFDDNIILPFQKLDVLDEGGSAQTYKVKLNREYNHLQDQGYPSGSNPTADDFVLKVYYTNEAERHYENETGALKRLMRARDKKDVKNVVIFYGSWVQGKTYNVLLEFADRGNLEDYWKTTRPPTDLKDITQFWSRLLDTTTALQMIHALEMHGEGLRVLQGIHQDIKPANILVFSGESQGDYDVTFKIADLGLSHFKTKVRHGEPIPTKDAYGTPMYSAPECCRLADLQQSSILITPSIDIWSYGCVLSEAATWVVLGPPGRSDYEQLRKEEIKRESPDLIPSGYGDCFHNGMSVLSAVNTMHKRLLERRRVSDLIIQGVTELIDILLWTDPRERYTATQLYKIAKRLVGSAKDENYPNAFRSIIGPVIIPPSQLTTSSADDYQPREGTYSSDYTLRTITSQVTTAASTPALGVQRMEPPQFPPRPLERSPHVVNKHRHISCDTTNTLGYRSPNAFGITAEVMTSQRATMLGTKGQNSMSPASPRTMSRVSFATQKPLIDNGIHEHEEGGAEGYGRKSLESTATAIYRSELPQNGSNVSARRTSSMIVSEPSSGVSKEYATVTVDYALNWHRNPGKIYDDPIENNLGRLQGRDHVFLIDDSESMKPYWHSVVRVFRALAGIVKHADLDGLDVIFATSLERKHGKKRSELVPIIERRKVAGSCNMKEALQEVFDKFGDQLEAPMAKRRSSLLRFGTRPPTSSTAPKTKRGLSVYVLTNGVWQQRPPPVCGVEEPIRHMVTKLCRSEKLDTKIGIQFIRFGNDPIGEERLDILDSLSRLQEVAPDIKMDIVDTTKHDGNVLKMLLGAIDRHWDDETPQSQLNHTAS